MKSDRLYEAAAFYRQGNHAEGLQRIRSIAVQSGDFFLFREAEETVTASDQGEDMHALAERAEALGRWHDARKAYERLNDQQGVQRAQESLLGLMKEAEETP